MCPRNYTIAKYSAGKIKLSTVLSQQEIPGRLAHEGTHMLQDLRGELNFYDFIDERTAYNAGFAVDKELGVSNAFNPSDSTIRLLYHNEFDRN